MALVTGYQHTLTEARLSILHPEAGKCIASSVEVSWLHLLVMHVQVVLGVIVSLISVPQAPENVVVALLHSVPYPIKAHINGYDCICLFGDSCGHGVIGLNEDRWLHMPKFLQDSA